MARLLYGATSGDYTMTAAGRVIPNAVVQIWDAIEDGNQITDLTDYDGNPCTVVTSGSDGLVRFYGPPGENDNLWMDTGQGERLLVRPTVLTASIGDGSILDEDINAAADIDRSKIAGTALTTGSTGVFNVADYGATGDGTDDSDAISATIAAAGEGGTVFFPPGIYAVSETLWPLGGQTWTGTHVPRYRIGDASDSECSIVALAGFTGRALIERTYGAQGVRLENLCLEGLGEEDSTTLDGIHFGDMTAERAWEIHGSTIRRFSGCGVTGRLHVTDIRDCHIVRNGYGLRVTGQQGVTDVRIIGSQFYYNLHGGICLDSDRRNGMVSITASRVERSGSTPADPSVNRDTAAPGIRLQHATNIDLVQVQTDANAGPGLLIDADPDNDKWVYACSIIGCQFARDGGGDQTTGAHLPGVKMNRALYILFTGNSVTWGQADDTGGTGPMSPYYGIWIEDTWHSDISHSWFTTQTPANSLHMVGDNFRTRVQSAHLGMDTLQPATDTERWGGDLPVGASYFSTTTKQPKWWDGSNWTTADGLAEDAPRNTLDIDGDSTVRKTLRYTTDGTVRWVHGLRTDADGNGFLLSRYDEAGFVEDSLTVSGATGTLTTKQQLIRSNSASRAPLEVRAAMNPTNSFFVVADYDGVPKLSVLYDAQIRANWADTGFARVRLGCTQILRDGVAAGNTLLAAYDTVANVTAGSPVFEVRGSGATKIGAAVDGTDAVQKDQIKTIVAASSDFADFKSRIASW